MHNIQLVKIQPEERLATSSELNPASCLVTGCGEAGGMGYWAATQVKGLSPKIFIVPEADVVVLTEGSTLIADSPIGTWQGDASPAGSETVARYQTDIMGTRETQSVLLTGVCAVKPINGKIAQTTLWESDQFIVPEKQGNACRGKGLAGARWPGRDTPSILRDGQGVSTKLWSITLRERRGCTPEEPDEGKLQVRFCEGAHSNQGLLPQKKVCYGLYSTTKESLIESAISYRDLHSISPDVWLY
ncbi:hypothetical protein C5S36_11260 [Candidatus Methanophagaceae archaeon]|nr:hypothetical protein C5S36_11260 [Methanophagales archaeon]